MQINIYRDQMQCAYLFGAPVLYSAQPIPREDVPQSWYCYDLRGTAQYPKMAYALVDKAEENHAGSVLSYLPLKSGRSQSRLVKDMLQPTGEQTCLADFCAEEKIRCPETPLRHMLRPASPEDAGLFYAQTPEKNAMGSPPRLRGGERRKERSGWSFRRQAETEQSEVSSDAGAIGHVRIDFGSGGKGFYHSWWPRGPEALNTQKFKDELDAVVDDLRKSVLKDLPSMRRYCYGSEGAIGVPAANQRGVCGGERRKERSGVEFSPSVGNETRGVSSDEGSSCCQNYGFTLETDRYLYRLRCNPVKGDYQVYLACFDKQAQQMGMVNAPVVGRISFASGEEMEYTDPQKYLEAIREELPYQATTGFRCETLTDDPAIRKAVDDMLYDLYGEENPRPLEDYGSTGMTMGGMS